MQILNKLSEKEKKLLFLLFTLIFVVLAYQFGYQTFARKAEDYNKKNEQLKTVLDEKREKAAKKSFYEKETSSMEEKIESINSQFPSYLTQEAGTIFISNLADYAGMKVSSIAFEDMSIFYSPDGTTASGENGSDEASNSEEDSDNAASEEVTEETADDTDNSDADNREGSESSDNSLQNLVSDLTSIGYKMGVTITYQASYEGLKKCMDYIKKEENRMNIRDISAAFDNSTGNLTGTITIDMYAYTGSGKAYEEPDLNDVEISTDNIFGTFEVPLE